MVSFTYVITDELGIHARPARLLIKETEKLESSVVICKGNRQADGKKIFSLMNLAAKKGDMLTVQVEGKNEAAEAEKIRAFLESNL